MRTDSLVIHQDDIGDVVGNFYGTPIREHNKLSTALREVDDAAVRIFLSQKSEEPPLPIEVLPGEVISPDNVIRRATAAEVRGDSFYAKEIPKGRQVTLEEAKQIEDAVITWYPNFAVIHDEVAD